MVLTRPPVALCLPVSECSLPLCGHCVSLCLYICVTCNVVLYCEWEIALLYCEWETALLYCGWEIALLYCEWETALLHCEWEIALLYCEWETDRLYFEWEIALLYCEWETALLYSEWEIALLYSEWEIAWRLTAYFCNEHTVLVSVCSLMQTKKSSLIGDVLLLLFCLFFNEEKPQTCLWIVRDWTETIWL